LSYSTEYEAQFITKAAKINALGNIKKKNKKTLMSYLPGLLTNRRLKESFANLMGMLQLCP